MGESIKSAALKYAAGGWPVFPCNPRTKAPLTPHGFKDASTSADQIELWWERWPKALIGVPTGIPISAFVIDVDAGRDEDTGEVFKLSDLIAQFESFVGCTLPATCSSNTPRGGRHFFFELPTGVEIADRIGLIPRVDVRSTGGYVIVPPSLRADGTPYVWDPQPETVPPAKTPAQIIDRLRRKQDDLVSRAAVASEKSFFSREYGLAALDGEAQSVANAAKGGRNARLNQAAFRIGQVIDICDLYEREVASALEAGAATCGLTADDGIGAVRRTIASGLSAGRKQPRLVLRGQPQAFTSRGRVADGGHDGDRLDGQLAQYELTDRGNAKRFVERNRGRLIFTSQGWLYWKDGRWVADENELQVKMGVHATVDAIKREASVMRKSETSDDEGES